MDERSDRLHPDLGNGFAYQCCPHLSATGTMDGAPVSGEFWVDRQWGRMDGWLVEPAEPGRRVLGWEWFGINFDSGHHLMIFRHNRAGRSDPARQCAVSFQDGPPRRLDRIEAQVLGNWISPVTGARYPVEWGFSLPEIDLQLRISPLTLNQEIPVFGSTAIWEGAARVTGRQGGHEIGGRARMELVGYGAPLSIADHVGRRLRRLQGDLLGDRLGSLLSAPQNRRR
jgi:predicted secreted hydrolase